jgi:hypothetical protein
MMLGISSARETLVQKPTTTYAAWKKVIATPTHAPRSTFTKSTHPTHFVQIGNAERRTPINAVISEIGATKRFVQRLRCNDTMPSTTSASIEPVSRRTIPHAAQMKENAVA